MHNNNHSDAQDSYTSIWCTAMILACCDRRGNEVTHRCSTKKIHLFIKAKICVHHISHIAVCSGVGLSVASSSGDCELNPTHQAVC